MRPIRQIITECLALKMAALADELSIDRVILNKIVARFRKTLKAKIGLFYKAIQKYSYTS